jgi:hypothetical protein
MLPAERLASPGPGKALVTFFRPTNFAPVVQMQLWDGQKLVGFSNKETYVQYECESGEHLFMARAENWSYVPAVLDSGKHYGLILRPKRGIVKLARVDLIPITKASQDVSPKEITAWLSTLKAETIDPELISMFEERWSEAVDAAIAEFPEKQEDTRHMRPDDWL